MIGVLASFAHVGVCRDSYNISNCCHYTWSHRNSCSRYSISAVSLSAAAITSIRFATTLRCNDVQSGSPFLGLSNPVWCPCNHMLVPVPKQIPGRMGAPKERYIVVVGNTAAVHKLVTDQSW